MATSKFSAIEEFIWEHRLHLTRQEVEIGIRKSVSEYLQTRDSTRRLFINLNQPKIGSEQWMYLVVRDLLPEHTRITSEEQLNSMEFRGIDILWIDDWSLSGCNACGTFENTFFNRPDSSSFEFSSETSSWEQQTSCFSSETSSWEQQTSCCSSDPISFDFSTFETPSFLPSQRPTEDVRYIFCTYVSTPCLYENVIRSSVQNVKVDFFSQREPKLLSEMVAETNTTFSPEILEAFHREVNPETEAEAYLICSDYKIPNAFGSYPSIYEKRLPPVNREFMHSVEREYLKLN